MFDREVRDWEKRLDDMERCARCFLWRSAKNGAWATDGFVCDICNRGVDVDAIVREEIKAVWRKAVKQYEETRKVG